MYAARVRAETLALLQQGESLSAVSRAGPRTYVYPRWQFVNVSDDIRHLCAWALDLVGIPWRQSNWKTTSVSRREAVARDRRIVCSAIEMCRHTAMIRSTS